MHRLASAVLWLLLGSSAAFASTRVNLPVYIEDSHAGTFYWIIQNLPLNRDFQLILIDAHSDASEILNSDAIRQEVVRAATDNRLDALVRRWRSKGIIQCFNWIEPLVPHPVSKVWWIPADSMTTQQIVQAKRQATAQFNAHEEALPRTEGNFSGRYEVMDLDHFMPREIDAPVVVSVDLDYFASGPSAESAQTRLNRVLESVLALPDLQALTFSISRPYLASEDQAHSLLYEAMGRMTRVVNADIHYEPFLSVGEDRSEKAKELYREKLDVPRYRVEDAPSFLRTFFLQNASRIAVESGRRQWEALLSSWKSGGDVPRIGLWVSDHRVGATEGHEVPCDQRFRLELEDANRWKGLQARWKVRTANSERYNLANENQGFAENAPKYLVYREETIASADGLLEVPGETLFPYLDRKTALGTLRVYCELSRGEETYTSNILQFSRYEGDGYVGKLTEIFNLPYVYGSALLRVEGKSGADARYGADCSNFIIYGRRREGFKIPYLNPKQLLPYLDEIDAFRRFESGVAYGQRGPIRVSSGLINAGLLLHFGRHVAAIYRNDDPRGVLTEETLVVHQLETYPEITTFAAMAAKYKEIRIMTFK